MLFPPTPSRIIHLAGLTFKNPVLQKALFFDHLVSFGDKTVENKGKLREMDIDRANPPGVWHRPPAFKSSGSELFRTIPARPLSQVGTKLDVRTEDFSVFEDWQTLGGLVLPTVGKTGAQKFRVGTFPVKIFKKPLKTKDGRRPQKIRVFGVKPFWSSKPEDANGSRSNKRPSPGR